MPGGRGQSQGSGGGACVRGLLWAWRRAARCCTTVAHHLPGAPPAGRHAGDHAQGRQVPPPPGSWHAQRPLAPAAGRPAACLRAGPGWAKVAALPPQGLGCTALREGVLWAGCGACGCRWALLLALLLPPVACPTLLLLLLLLLLPPPGPAAPREDMFPCLSKYPLLRINDGRLNHTGALPGPPPPAGPAGPLCCCPFGLLWPVQCSPAQLPMHPSCASLLCTLLCTRPACCVCGGAKRTCHH